MKGQLKSVHEFFSMRPTCVLESLHPVLPGELACDEACHAAALAQLRTVVSLVFTSLFLQLVRLRRRGQVVPVSHQIRQLRVNRRLIALRIVGSLLDAA